MENREIIFQTPCTRKNRFVLVHIFRVPDPTEWRLGSTAPAVEALPGRRTEKLGKLENHWQNIHFPRWAQGTPAAAAAGRGPGAESGREGAGTCKNVKNKEY